MSRFAIVVLLFAGFAAQAALAQSPFGGPPPQPIFCPPVLNIQGVHSIALPKDAGNAPLGSVAAPGWNGSAIQFEAYYPPEIRQGAMICHYRIGGQLDGYGIYQMIGPRHCVVRRDKRGFDCRR